MEREAVQESNGASVQSITLIWLKPRNSSHRQGWGWHLLLMRLGKLLLSNQHPNPHKMKQDIELEKPESELEKLPTSFSRDRFLEEQSYAKVGGTWPRKVGLRWRGNTDTQLEVICGMSTLIPPSESGMVDWAVTRYERVVRSAVTD